MKMPAKFGTDPEMFLTKDEFVIPPIVVEKMGLKRIGTLVQDDPDYHPVFFRDDKITLIGDGAAFEFNTPVAYSPEELQDFYLYGKKILHEIATSVNLEVAAIPAARFDLDSFEGYFPDPRNNEKLWHACRFGCDRQHNIYELNRQMEIDAKDIKWRYAGGHIHASCFKFDIFQHYTEYVKLMDVVVGTNCLLHSPYRELEFQRQLFYGIPGNYRPQEYSQDEYGIEYRTPSVSWLETFEGIKQVFEGIELVERIIVEDKAEEILTKYNHMAIDAILQFDLTAVQEIQKQLKELT